MVQFLVLAEANRCAALVRYPDNVRILEAAARCVLLSEQDIKQLTASYLALRATLHEFAIKYNESDAVDADVAHAVMEPLLPMQNRVISVWNKVFSAYQCAELSSIRDAAEK